MKKIFSALVLMIAALSAVAQDKPLTFAEVIQVEGRSQSEIFGGLRQWVATTFVNGKAVTQLEDAATGTIILKALFPYKKGGIYSAYEGHVDYMLKLQAKDGRYRVEMSNISHENKPGRAADCSLGLITTAEKSGKGGINKSGHDKIWKEIKTKAEEQFKELVTSLKGITTFDAAPEEDW